MKNEKQITPEMIVLELETIKNDIDAKCEQIAERVGKIGAFVLPMSYSNDHVTIQITTVKTKRAGTGKRQIIVHDGIEYPTYAALCDHLELSHVGNSAHRVLDANNIQYELVDKTATTVDKK